MKTVTWEPGTDKELDELFHSLREQQYQDRTHRLWKNYGSEYWADAGIIANTICFDNNDVPEMCSTIASRTCWPAGVYRILNRLWRHSNKVKYPRTMSKSFAESAINQIDWLKHNTDYKLVFMSRQTNNWRKFTQEQFLIHGLELKMDNYKYLTCPNECDDTCWQHILYYGYEQLLLDWKKQC
jgi:hypothetical protein